ncbi:hypothetical protein FPV67DRAFT_1495667 [Lyophyllum atratum]|nr:hypothetical protein FPV67DRAFT_1495667 [Lyophyllum atratum]
MFLRISKLVLTALVMGNLGMNAALGSIWPTQPIAKTKFSSGQLALVTWREDWRTPHLGHTGHMKIDLHGNSKYIATLAKYVAPTACSHSVFIPPGLENDSHYTLRFITTDPLLTIYTANFTIITESYLFPTRPAILNSTTPSTTSMHSFDPAAVPTMHTNPMGAHPDGPSKNSGNPGAGSGKRNASAKVNLETIRFRLLAVLWPALVGISIAL